MTTLPDWALWPRKLDGGAVRMSPKADGGAELLEWSGDTWVTAAGVDWADFMAAPPATASFLDKVGVPSDDPARAAA